MAVYCFSSPSYTLLHGLPSPAHTPTPKTMGEKLRTNSRNRQTIHSPFIVQFVDPGTHVFEDADCHCLRTWAAVGDARTAAGYPSWPTGLDAYGL